MILHKVNSICADRCNLLYSVASNSPMPSEGLVISICTVRYHRTNAHINGAALAFDDLKQVTGLPYSLSFPSSSKDVIRISEAEQLADWAHFTAPHRLTEIENAAILKTSLPLKFPVWIQTTMDFPYHWHADAWRPILRLFTELFKCKHGCEAYVSDLVLESHLLKDQHGGSKSETQSRRPCPASI